MKMEKLDSMEGVIRDCFATDPALIATWHIEAGSGLESCVWRTAEDLRSSPTLEFYTVMVDKEIAGFAGKDKDKDGQYLIGFFLKPKFRDEEGKERFWDLVKDLFDNKPFFCPLYNKNKRAINFLMRHGGELVPVMKEESDVSLFYLN